MNIHLSGQHLDVTDAIRAHLEKKIQKLKKHFDHLVDIHVIFKVENNQHFAEATIHLSKHKLFATAVSDDMYATIDTMINKLDRQLIKHKEKLKDHHNKSMDHHVPKK